MTTYTDLEEVAQQIRAGTLDKAKGVEILARRANIDTSIALVAVNARLAALQATGAASAPDERDPARSAGTPVAAVPAKGQRAYDVLRSVGRVPGADFLQVMKDVGLMNQSAVAILIDRSQSRVHELITEGAGMQVFLRFKERLETHAAEAKLISGTS